VDFQRPTPIVELNEAFLDFEWEPLMGYDFHFLNCNSSEWLFWDNDKNHQYHVKKFALREFAKILEEFYLWGNTIFTSWMKNTK